MTSKFKKRLTSVLAALMLLTTILTTVSPAVSYSHADSNVASWIMCMSEDGSIAYNAATTDVLYYSMRSKSALTKSDDVVYHPLNFMLKVAGYDFNEANEAILGRPINPDNIPEETQIEANQNANKFNVFDRFGVAGLRWSSYSGEWKYYQVDACSNSEQASKTNFGEFYENRKEPKSTYDEVGTSSDPRSKQFSMGLMSSWGSSFKDTIANFIFGITKSVVSVTIALVGLAFTDITEFLGLSSGGDASAEVVGAFNSIYTGIFQAFVGIAILVMSLYFIYYGLVKRQFRQALDFLGKAVIIFVLAIMVGNKPAKLISLPNKVAMYGQSMVLSAMSTSYNSKGTLCETNKGLLAPTKDGSYNQSELDGISKNMQSVVGCRMWEEMLFKPWARGQFGVDYTELDNGRLGNINGEWVGDASVPLGDGATINNWAVFQLSTQTNAHSALGEDSNIPSYINGVSNDWWRVADALSNYDEESFKEDIGRGGGTITYDRQVNSKPTEYWQTWVGNDSADRMGVATLSLLFGGVGSIPLIIISLLSAVYGFLLTLIMIIGPIFFLFGISGPKGAGMFMGWLELLINTMLKKIISAGLLVITFGVIMTSMDMIYTVGWVQSFLLLIIMSTILVKNRYNILNSLANVNFGGIFDPSRGFNEAVNKYKKKTRQAGLIAVGGVAGAKAGMSTGQSAVEGFNAGAKSQVLNTLRQSQMGQKAYTQYQSQSKGREGTLQRNCIVCGINLHTLEQDKFAVIAFVDDYGNYYCQFCGEEAGSDNLTEVSIDREPEKSMLDLSDEERAEMGKRSVYATKNRSWLSHSVANSHLDAQLTDDGIFTIDNDSVKYMIEGNLKRLEEDMIVFKDHQKRYGELSLPPAIPEPIREYVDIALLNEAWTSGQFEYVDYAYREAWAQWYMSYAEPAGNVSDSEIEKAMEEIRNFAYEVDDEDAVIREHGLKRQDKTLSEHKRNKDVAYYEDGELRTK